jgi:hypothetical protein
MGYLMVFQIIIRHCVNLYTLSNMYYKTEFVPTNHSLTSPWSCLRLTAFCRRFLCAYLHTSVVYVSRQIKHVTVNMKCITHSRRDWHCKHTSGKYGNALKWTHTTQTQTLEADTQTRMFHFSKCLKSATSIALKYHYFITLLTYTS